MIQFRDGFYADIRTEDRSRTSIAYQGKAFWRRSSRRRS